MLIRKMDASDRIIIKIRIMLEISLTPFIDNKYNNKVYTFMQVFLPCHSSLFLSIIPACTVTSDF